MGELILRKPILCGTNENDQLLKIFDLLGCPRVEDRLELEKLPNFACVERYEGVFTRDHLRERFPMLSPQVLSCEGNEE